MPVSLFFLAVSVLWGAAELSVFSAALFGGLCAFLIYNFHPAKVFMGDTGSDVYKRQLSETQNG